MGKQIRLTGSWVIEASRTDIYNIMTDFEKMPEYFPSVAKSLRIVSRQGNNLTINAETKAFLRSKTFKVFMETQLRPPTGFVSKNSSTIAIEDEVFSMEEIPEGTKITYTNDVEIKNRLWRLFGKILMVNFALKYWEREVINKLKEMLEK
jgi:hypothetical protein